MSISSFLLSSIPKRYEFVILFFIATVGGGAMLLLAINSWNEVPPIESLSRISGIAESIQFHSTKSGGYSVLYLQGQALQHSSDLREFIKPRMRFEALVYPRIQSFQIYQLTVNERNIVIYQREVAKSHNAAYIAIIVALFCMCGCFFFAKKLKSFKSPIQ